MKRKKMFRKHRMTALLLGVLFLCTQTVGLAASVTGFEASTLPEKYDPINMTFEERAAWIEANLEPVYTGQAQPISRSEWLYTSLRTDVVDIDDMFDVGKLETQMKFTCNDQLTAVTDFGTVVFRATPYRGSLVDTNYFVNDDTPYNIRVVYEAWFATAGGTRFVEHWYTLHGHGTYSLYVVTDNGADFVR